MLTITFQLNQQNLNQDQVWLTLEYLKGGKMNSDELKAKLTHYYDLRNELKNADIEEKVDERLEEMRDEVRVKVKAEIDADIIKCTNYVELLDDLVKEQCNIEDRTACAPIEAPIEAEVDVKEPAIEAETNAPTESATLVDTITVEGGTNQCQ